MASMLFPVVTQAVIHRKGRLTTGSTIGTTYRYAPPIQRMDSVFAPPIQRGMRPRFNVDNFLKSQGFALVSMEVWERLSWV
jgi:hypothetical protein